MKKITCFSLIAMLLFITVLSGCGKSDAEVAEEAIAFTDTLRILNIKSEVDAQATLKGYYLSDQMPDIIACEAPGFGNWEGLLVDLSDQDWASRTDAAYVDSTYGTLGFPYTTEAIGFAYNADILAECGIDSASITGPDSMKAAIEAIDSKKDQLGLKAVVGYCAEPENLGWSSGNHIFGAYLDSGLARTDTTCIDLLNQCGALDADRFSHYADMIGLFIQYSDPDLVLKGSYDDQVLGFASGKYAFITQGSWIGATLTGADADAYAKAGNFAVGTGWICLKTLDKRELPSPSRNSLQEKLTQQDS